MIFISSSVLFDFVLMRFRLLTLWAVVLRWSALLLDTQRNKARSIEPTELNTLFFFHLNKRYTNDSIDDTLVIHHIIHSCLVLRYGHAGSRMMIADNTPFGMSLDGCVMCMWNWLYGTLYLRSLDFRMKIVFDAQSTNDG